MKNELASIASALRDNSPLCDDALDLCIGQCRLRVLSNSPRLLSLLRDYFSHVVSTAATPAIEVIAIERDVLDLGVQFTDWQREPGKSGRKDTYLDLPAGRLLLKVRTGMLFLQSEKYRIAAGPCVQYDSQLINFINTQYMNWLQQRDWLICHASALARHGSGFAIAGLSGGGKSTLMLQLLEEKSVLYMTNDRLFIKRESGQTQAAGIPKLPRINPGTIVHNATLQHLIDPNQRAELLKLPPQSLWELEDKYDVHVDGVYGAGRIKQQAPLAAFLILNWQRDSQRALAVERVDLADRRDLLAAIMKSPGPFYQYADGSFFQHNTAFNEQAYVDALDGVRIYEASGGVDFAALSERCLEELTG